MSEESSIHLICFSCHAGSEVPIEAAGQEVACPSCGVPMAVPMLDEAESVPGGEASSMWHFRMPNGKQFGPVTWEELDNYVFEGVITAECHVLEQGTDQWLWAGEVLAEVPDFESEATRNRGDQTTLRGGVAAAGLLNRLPCMRERFPDDYQEAHWGAHAKLERECNHSDEGFRFLGSRSLGLVQGVQFSDQFVENFSGYLPSRKNVLTNSVTIGACALGSLDLYVVIPWSTLEMLPHELFAIVPGRLASSFALRMTSSGTRVWVGGEGRPDDPVALVAKSKDLDAGHEIVWKWTSRERRGKFMLDWGLQCVPLGSEQFLINLQTARKRSGRITFGIDDFFADIGQITRFAMRLEVPGACEARVPFHSESAELVARMFV